MLKKIILFLGIISIFGCVTTSPKHVNNNITKNEAVYQLKTCLVRNIKSLDDGISDAYSIAKAVSSSCWREHENYKWASFKDISNARVRQELMQDKDLNNKFIDQIISLVLFYRQK